MPLVRVDLPRSTPHEHRDEIVEVVYDALVRIGGAPVNDRFMIIAEHDTETLVMDRNYIVDRTEDALIIQITLNTGRTTEVKKAMFKAIAEGLRDRIDMRPEDVFINLVEVAKENWSFGNGEAQYAD